MKRKTAKRFFSTVLAMIILLGIIPVSSFMSASASQTEVSAFNAADVINGLATDGNVIITLENDIDIQVDEYFEWGYNSDTERWLWATVASGKKRLILNGHTLAVDDALVDTAQYRTEKQYNPETGVVEEKFVFVANAFRQKAALIYIPDDAELFVDGKAGGKVMMTAKVPDNELMMDSAIVMQRDVFLVKGRLTTEGGTYQAGRRKSHYVNNAIKCDDRWYWELGLLGEPAGFWGYGEYAINGTAISTYGGITYVWGGTFIGHGFEYGNPDWRNGVLEVTNAGRLYIYDCNVQGYSGANCFKVTVNSIAYMYSGWTKTYAPDRYLWPRGAARANADESYCSAINVGLGSAAFPIEMEGRTSESANGGILYGPEASTKVDGLRWYTGGTSSTTYAIGSSKKAIFDMGELYFYNFATGNYIHDVDYTFMLSEQQGDGKWKSVTEWITNGRDDTVDLANMSEYMNPGGTYRIYARAIERWSSDHNFIRTVTAENSLAFTTAPFVISELSLHFNDPTADEPLAKAEDVTGADGCTVESVQWSTSSTTYPANAQVTPGYGETLTAKVTLKLKTGVTLADKVTARINGSAANMTVNGDAIVLTRTFPPTARIISGVGLYVTEPAVGVTPISATVGIPLDVHYTHTELRYYESEDGENYVLMSANKLFTAGMYYKAEIDIATTDGYEFLVDSTGVSVVPDFEATVNGRWCVTQKIYGEAPQEAATVVWYFGVLVIFDGIDTVSITGIDAPYPGQTPDYFAYAEGDDYAFYLGSDDEKINNGIFWSYKDGNKSKMMSQSETFKAGVDYTVYALLTATGGNTFAIDDQGESAVSATVNGKAASAIATSPQTSKNFTVVSYTFTWQVVEVSEVDVGGLTLPLAGAHPDYELTVGNSELYEIKNIQWYQGDYESGTPIYEEDTFASSDTYAVEIRVSRKIADQLVISQFKKPVTVYFNGIESDSAEIMANQTDVYIFMNFNTEGGGIGQSHIAGDINDDGAVNNKDLTRLFQYLSDWDVTVNTDALDVNGDGSVNNKDLTRLFQYLSDWDVEIF